MRAQEGIAGRLRAFLAVRPPEAGISTDSQRRLWRLGRSLIVPALVLLFQLQHEKAELEQHLEQEQEFQVNKLMKKIKKLENDTISKQLTLEQVSRGGPVRIYVKPPPKAPRSEGRDTLQLFLP